MREEFNIATEADTRLWNKYTSNTYEQLARLDNTVQDAGLFSGQSRSRTKMVRGPDKLEGM